MFRMEDEAGESRSIVMVKSAVSATRVKPQGYHFSHQPPDFRLHFIKQIHIFKVSLSFDILSNTTLIYGTFQFATTFLPVVLIDYLISHFPIWWLIHCHQTFIKREQALLVRASRVVRMPYRVGKLALAFLFHQLHLYLHAHLRHVMA